MAVSMFIILIVAMLIGLPIVASCGIASVSYFLMSGMNISIVVQRMISATNSIVLVAVPAFIVAGAVMEKGGLANRLIKLSDALVGGLPGGLGMVTLFTAMFFSAISGSNIATAAAVGGIMIPAMKERGYPPDYSAAITSAGGTMGGIIPPSLGMVIFSSLTGTSLTSLFMAGIPAGILMCLAMMVVNFIVAKKSNFGRRETKYTPKEFGKILVDALWALGTPLIILGGIFGGICTATEAAVVSVVYGIIVSMCVYKEIKIKDIWDILLSGAVTSAKVMFILAVANSLGWILSFEKVPQAIYTLLTTITNSDIVIWLIINVVLLIAGCFMDASAITIIFAPVLASIITLLGASPIHLGIVFLVNLSIGNITPPLGACLYTGAMVGHVSVEKVARRVMPFMIALLVVLAIITYWPDSVMFLPKLTGKA